MTFYTGLSGSVLGKLPSRLQDEKHIFWKNYVGFSCIARAVPNRTWNLFQVEIRTIWSLKNKGRQRASKSRLIFHISGPHIQCIWRWYNRNSDINYMVVMEVGWVILIASEIMSHSLTPSQTDGRDPRTADRVVIFKVGWRDPRTADLVVFLKGDEGTHGPQIWSEFFKGDQGIHGPPIWSYF